MQSTCASDLGEGQAFDEPVEGLVERLGRRGITFRVDGEALCMRAPRGAITSADRAELAARKGEIITLLANSASASLGAAPAAGPLSPEQELVLRAAGGVAYVVSGVFHTLQVTPPSAFDWALRTVVLRHEALRVRIDTGVEPACMRVCTMPLTPVHWIDLRFEDEKRARAALHELAEAEAQRPFLLATEPPLRVRAAVLPDGSCAFVLSLHHLVVDRASMDILGAELTALLDASDLGRPAQLPPVSGSFVAIAGRRRACAETAEFDDHAEQLAMRMRDAALPQLPADGASQGDPTASVQRVTQRFAAGVVARLRQRRRPVADVLAALFTLLRRYAGDRAVFIGLSVSLRDDSETDAVIGMLTNTVPISCRPRGDCNFDALSALVAEEISSALDRRATPMTKVLQRLDPEERAGSCSPFRIIASSTSRGATSASRGARFQTAEPGRSLTKCDLLFLIQDGAVVFEYSDRAFASDAVVRLGQDFVTILEVGLKAPERSLDEIDPPPHLDPEHWVPSLPIAALHDLVAAQVAMTPDRVALTDYSCAVPRLLTYGELSRRSARLAQALLNRGIGPEDRVAIACDSGVERTLAVLGVLRAGGAYVPIDPRWPSARRDFVLSEACVKLLLTDVDDGGVAASTRLTIRHLLREPDTTILPRVPAAQLAYVLYTSGSTGEPQGVAIEHHSVCALAAWARAAYSSAELGRVLGATPLHVDLSVFEVFAPLTTGGEVTTATLGLELPAIVRRAAPTLINTVPSLAAEALRAGLELRSVLTMNLAGETLDGQLVNHLKERGLERLINVYGACEATTYSTERRVDGAFDCSIVGRPIVNTHVYLAELDRDPTRQLWAGEANIAGAGVARGYLARPGQTAAAFRPNPFGSRGTRVFRSGDRMRVQMPRGLKFLGRHDRLVRRRGLRIELDEIEAAIRLLPGAREVAVVAEPRSQTAVFIRAFVVVEQGFARAQIASGLARTLPNGMMPDELCLVETLPRTSSGKIRRRGLSAASATPRLPSAFAGEEENAVAAIWSSVIGVGVSDPEARFFEAGGDSLKLMRVSERLRGEFGLEFSAVELLRNPTIRSMAALVAARRGR
jgi:amino acid adenylation domain-containing protein